MEHPTNQCRIRKRLVPRPIAAQRQVRGRAGGRASGRPHLPGSSHIVDQSLKGGTTVFYLLRLLSLFSLCFGRTADAPVAAWGWERWDLSPALWSPARAETETQGWCRHKGALHHHAAKSSLAQPRGCFFSLGHAGRVYYDGCALVTVNGNVVAQVRTPRPYRTVPCSMLQGV